jgi:hypothetical protein
MSDHRSKPTEIFLCNIETEDLIFEKITFVFSAFQIGITD